MYWFPNTWFEFFLSYKRFLIFVGDTPSEAEILNFDVPRGSLSDHFWAHIIKQYHTIEYLE